MKDSLNCRTSSTISHPDEPINSIEGVAGQGNVSQGAARVYFERNTVNPEGREGEYINYREGVGPTHPYRYIHSQDLFSSLIAME